jgi:hypothetical protein
MPDSNLTWTRESKNRWRCSNEKGRICGEITQFGKEFLAEIISQKGEKEKVGVFISQPTASEALWQYYIGNHHA